jgi:hypothetical protein
MNSNGMKTIHLAMGRSTIVQFMDSPKKIVSGNSNYFNVEFTGNDVTIQPLAQISSNLFVYSGHRRFGFLLKVCQLCRNYDDLVKVYWSNPYKRKVDKKASRAKAKFKARSFNAGKAKVFVSKVFYHKFNDVYVVDGSFVVPKSAALPKAKDFWVTRKGKKLSVLDVVFTDEVKFKTTRTKRFRLFLKLTEPVDFTFRAAFENKNGYTTVLRSQY